MKPFTRKNAREHKNDASIISRLFHMARLIGISPAVELNALNSLHFPANNGDEKREPETHNQLETNADGGRRNR